MVIRSRWSQPFGVRFLGPTCPSNRGSVSVVDVQRESVTVSESACRRGGLQRELVL